MRLRLHVHNIQRNLVALVQARQWAIRPTGIVVRAPFEKAVAAFYGAGGVKVAHLRSPQRLLDSLARRLRAAKVSSRKYRRACAVCDRYLGPQLFQKKLGPARTSVRVDDPNTVLAPLPFIGDKRYLIWQGDASEVEQEPPAHRSPPL